MATKVTYFDGSELRLFSGIADVIKDSRRSPSGVSSYATTMENSSGEGSTGFISAPRYYLANMFCAIDKDSLVTQAYFARTFPFDCLFVFAPVQSRSEKYGFVGCGAAEAGSHYATIAGIANVTLDSYSGSYPGGKSWIEDHRGSGTNGVKVVVYCFPMKAQYATGITEVKLEE